MRFKYQCIERDLERFRNLNENARSLFVSFIAFNVATPLLGLFCNAFIWRQKQELIHVAIFNGAWMLGVMLAFIVNGVLLQYMSLKWLYAIGLVMQSVACTVLFLVGDVDAVGLVVVGFLFGVTAALYWANRNLLTLQLTQGDERDYFCGLESALGTLLSIVSPLVFGWFIQMGTGLNSGSVVDRYRVAIVGSFLIQLIGGWYIVRARFHDYTPRSIFILRASRLWNRARIFTALKGVADGSGAFIPTLIILSLVGQEGILGTLHSLAIGVTSAVLYGVSRWVHYGRRSAVLASGVILMVQAGLTLSIWFSSFGAIAYLLLQTLGIQLLWASANPLIFDAIDADRQGDGETYKYIVDREVALNVGRLSGVILTATLGVLCGDSVALRTAPLVLALATSSLLFVSKGLRPNAQI